MPRNTVTASWAVQYRDGSWLSQWDDSHPMAVSGEVPFRAIDWPQVQQLRFESNQAVLSLEMTDPSEGLKWSLRSRTWLRADTGQPSAYPHGLTAFLLVLSEVDKPVGPDTVRYVRFWFPDGTEHETPIFNSPAAGEYGAALVAGKLATLMPITDQLHLQSSAELTK